MNRYLIKFTAMVMIASCASCDRKPDSDKTKPAPPAKVENPVKETDLASIRLSPKAEERLGVETTAVESRRIRRTRTLGGDVVVPAGRRIIVSAPLAGTLTAPDGVPAPRAGTHLTNGQTVLRLSPVFLSDREVLQASDRISLESARANLSTAIAGAEGDVATAEIQIQAAQLKMNRADKLRKEKVGSVRAYEEAEAELRLAKANAKAAQHRLDTLKNIHLEAEPGQVALLSIGSPQEGLLEKMHAVPGEAVVAGAPLFEVVDIDPIWIRVPLYVGDLDAIEPQAPAGITDLTFKAGSPVRSAKPIVAPPSANAQAATVDLFYQLDNGDASLLPGQKVGVTLTLKTAEESLVVPWSAVLYDVNGDTWVYENTEPQVFVRRRIEVRHIIDGLAVLERGPAIGKKVVTTAAAELFGTEFGGGK